MISKKVPCKGCISFAICKGKVIDSSNNENLMHISSRSLLEEDCIILHNFVKDEGYALGEIELELIKIYSKSFKLSIRAKVERLHNIKVYK